MTFSIPSSLSALGLAAMLMLGASAARADEPGTSPAASPDASPSSSYPPSGMLGAYDADCKPSDSSDSSAAGNSSTDSTTSSDPEEYWEDCLPDDEEE